MKLLLVHDKDLSAAASGIGVCSERAGGLAVYLVGLVAGLAEQGVEVVLVDVAPEASDALQASLEPLPGAACSVALAGYRFRPRRSALVELERLLARERPDVVHLHGAHELHPGFTARLGAAAPLVHSLHDVGSVCLRGTLVERRGRACSRRVGIGCVARGCERPWEQEPRAAAWLRAVRARPRAAAIGDADALVVPSGFLRDALVRNGLPAGRTHLLPLFPPRSIPSASTGVENGARHGAPTKLLFVGRLTADKGVWVLLEALGRLARGGIEFEALLIGDGAIRVELERRIADAGLAEQVRLAGECGAADLAAAYAAADLVVVPSVAHEAFGLVGVEAMAAARPVVAADAGGVHEWLADGRTGLLARRGDAADLALRLAELCRDPDRRRAMGAAARVQQRARFTRERHTAALLELYGSLVAARCAS